MDCWLLWDSTNQSPPQPFNNGHYIISNSSKLMQESEFLHYLISYWPFQSIMVISMKALSLAWKFDYKRVPFDRINCLYGALPNQMYRSHYDVAIDSAITWSIVDSGNKQTWAGIEIDQWWGWYSIVRQRCLIGMVYHGSGLGLPSDCFIIFAAVCILSNYDYLHSSFILDKI